jgi:Fur family ferric uptake transcriptional regulator
MDAKLKFNEFLRQKSLRQTQPRQYVVDAFLRTEKHVSTQELYDIVRRKHPDIGYATVARTLKLLTQANLCREIDFGDGMHRFEHKFNHGHHDHLTCTACGKFVEIFSPQLEKIQNQLVKKHGFIAQSHQLNIFGTCPKCQKKKKKPTR